MDEMVLINRVREECDDFAFNEIVKEYARMLESIISSYEGEFGDFKLNRDDLRQEAYIALYDACKSYKVGMDTKFSTFAYTCIKRRVHRFYSRYVRCYCKETTSLDSFETRDPGFLYYSTCVNEDAYNKEKENRIEALKIIMDSLSYEDRTIVDMRMNNYSYQEISNKLNINKKRVDNRLNKIKKKYANGSVSCIYKQYN